MVVIQNTQLRLDSLLKVITSNNIRSNPFMILIFKIEYLYKNLHNNLQESLTDHLFSRSQIRPWTRWPWPGNLAGRLWCLFCTCQWGVGTGPSSTARALGSILPSTHTADYRIAWCTPLCCLSAMPTVVTMSLCWQQKKTVAPLNTAYTLCS